MPSAKAIDIVIDIDCAAKYCDLRLIVSYAPKTPIKIGAGRRTRRKPVTEPANYVSV